MSSQSFEKDLNKSSTKVAEFKAQEKTAFEKLQFLLHSKPTLIPLIILVCSVIVFAIISEGKFLSLYNGNVILQRVSIIGTLAIAQAIIIITAGIDLSIGAIMIFSSMLMGNLAVNMGFPPFFAVFSGSLFGVIAGFFNGLLVTKVKLPPFIATLGSWRIFYALIFIVFGSQAIRSSDIDSNAPLLKFWGESLSLGPVIVSYGSLVFIFIAIAVWYILHHTAWGRHVYAIGDDIDAADLSGIRSNRMLLSVYAFAGGLAGFVGWMVIGRLGSASPVTYVEANLESITAVVIGGVSLFGGRGTIIGVIFGALIVQVFDSGLNFTDLDTQFKYLALGLLIIFAVAIDQWIRKVAS